MAILNYVMYGKAGIVIMKKMIMIINIDIWGGFTGKSV